MQALRSWDSIHLTMAMCMRNLEDGLPIIVSDLPPSQFARGNAREQEKSEHAGGCGHFSQDLGAPFWAAQCARLAPTHQSCRAGAGTRGVVLSTHRACLPRAP